METLLAPISPAVYLANAQRIAATAALDAHQGACIACRLKRTVLHDPYGCRTAMRLRNTKCVAEGECQLLDEEGN